MNIIDVAEVNQQRWLEESGQWLENVDLVLASGKPVLQKSQQSSLGYKTKRGNGTPTAHPSGP